MQQTIKCVPVPSGARKAGVVFTLLAEFRLASSSGLRNSEIPKSVIFTFPHWSTRRFSGLISACITPWLWTNGGVTKHAKRDSGRNVTGKWLNEHSLVLNWSTVKWRHGTSPHVSKKTCLSNLWIDIQFSNPLYQTRRNWNTQRWHKKKTNITKK